MGFVGFKFNNGAGPQFGWARVRISSWFPGGYAFRVLDFAYGDPGKRITAGEGIPRGNEDDQDISDDQAPDEGSLGGLALGAVALLGLAEEPVAQCTLRRRLRRALLSKSGEMRLTTASDTLLLSKSAPTMLADSLHRLGLILQARDRYSR